MTPGTVLTDHNRRTAIVVDQGRKLTHVVPMEEGELVVRALTQDELDERGVRVLAYDIKKAVRKYLKHSGGVSPKARKMLRALIIKGELP